MKKFSNAINQNPPGGNRFNDPIILEESELPDVLVNSIVKDTLPDEKPIDTSITPIIKNKEKKPIYSQVNSKQLNSALRNSKKSLNAVTDTGGKELAKPKVRKKVILKEDFLDIVEVESYKKENKKSTWPDGGQPDYEEDSCQKCKECFERTCLII